MNILKNPDWLKEHQHGFSVFNDIPASAFESVNSRLRQIQSDSPLVSVVLTAWNEEANIFNCVSSLSAMVTKYPFEIIVVNNNSTDGTQKILDRLAVRNFIEKVQGCGPARQLGQEMARGKYVLTGDADCLYPPGWIDEMMSALTQPEVVCVYGRYSFIADDKYPRWKLQAFEMMKDIIAEYRHINRPYFNAYGMSMGYVLEYGLKVGFITINRRGEDGQLCLDLMPYGKIKQVKSDRARVWTGTRTLQQEGSFGSVLYARLKKEFRRFFFNLHSGLPGSNKDPRKSRGDI